MKNRTFGLTILSLFVLSACVAMDEGAPATERVVSAVVVDQRSGQEFVVELAYTDAVTYDEAVVLVNNIAVVHEHGIGLADDSEPALEGATSLVYEEARLSDLSTHVFQVQVYSATLDLSEVVDDYRWAWVEDELVEFVKHCPPGHGG